ncbi:MAG: patatin-like phospholipase family protein, partial [Clostridiales bacterium]|nr:patatin-like phospholipase family protein [Candidatus Apopatousia equi]
VKKTILNNKIGIAFGGGGARGFAHVGAIKAFEEAGIEFDEVAGTSAGSLVGALYAYGLTSDEMIEIAKNVKQKDIKRGGIFFMPSDTDGIQNIIKNSIGDVMFDELKRPFTAVAVDLITAKEVHISNGNVAKAVAGSCAVPGFFKPVEFENYRLADGGLQNTIPADVVRNNGCNIVISVDVNFARGYGTESTKLLDILAASIRIMMKSNAVNGKLFSDLVIEPDLRKFKSTSMEGYMDMIKIGYEETKKHIPEIKQMLGLVKPIGFWSRLFRKNKQKILQEKQIESIEIDK